MLILRNGDTVEINLSAALSTQVHASWVDKNSSTGSITAGRSNTTWSTTGAHIIVPDPGSSAIERTVEFITVYNNGASAQIATIRHNDASVIVPLRKRSLEPGEVLPWFPSKQELTQDIGDPVRFDIAQARTLLQQLQARANIGGMREVDDNKSLNGLTQVNWTDLPSGIKEFSVAFANSTTNGASTPVLRLGGSGGIETSGYLSPSVISLIGGANFGNQPTTGFGPAAVNASTLINGILHARHTASNVWVFNSVVAVDTTNVVYAGGLKQIASELTQLRWTTENGTDAFDGGFASLLYRAP